MQKSRNKSQSALLLFQSFIEANATTLCFASVTIFACDLNLSAAEFTASRLRDEGGTVDVMTADVTVMSDVEKVVKECMAKHQRIDILVNNVGKREKGP